MRVWDLSCGCTWHSPAIVYDAHELTVQPCTPLIAHAYCKWEVEPIVPIRVLVIIWYQVSAEFCFKAAAC